MLCILVMIYNTYAQNSIWHFTAFGVEAANLSIEAIATTAVMNGRKAIIEFLHECFSLLRRTDERYNIYCSRVF